MRGQIAGEAKVFIWQRVFIENVVKQQELLRRGYLVLAEIDDDPLRWSNHQASDFFTFRSCHAVQVSTEPLAQFIRQFNPNVAVFPNQLAYLPQPRLYKDEGQLTIFFGALNREADWLPIMPELNKICNRYPSQVKVIVIHDKTFFEALETSNKEFVPFCSYHEYVSVLGKADIAILPLLSNRFNSMKSDLKFLECAGHGVAALASPTVYESTITDGETGFIYHTPAQFTEKLTILIEDEGLRRGMARNAYHWVAEHRLLSQHYRQRYEWYQSLLEQMPELNEDLEKRVPGILSSLPSLL